MSWPVCPQVPNKKGNSNILKDNQTMSNKKLILIDSAHLTPTFLLLSKLIMLQLWEL